jgi:hypothetical protein
MIDDDERVMNKPLIGIAIAVVIAAGGGWWFWHSRLTAPPPAPVAAAPVPQTAPAPDDTIAHPVPAAAASATPLPELADSDAPLSAALGEAAGGADATQYLIPGDLIRHIVVSVDNLLRQKVAVDKRPVTPVAGPFIADGDELHATLDARNFKRYAPMVGVLEKVDMSRLVAVYLRFYPLFQQAYQDLGYPNGYFNDRLVKVIDGLLATPQVGGPIELVRPNVMYVFADPSLEARPAGQKLLIRMGPDNAAVVKAKLKELRAAITAAPPQH